MESNRVKEDKKQRDIENNYLGNLAGDIGADALGKTLGMMPGISLAAGGSMLDGVPAVGSVVAGIGGAAGSHVALQKRQNSLTAKSLNKLIADGGADKKTVHRLLSAENPNTIADRLLGISGASLAGGLFGGMLSGHSPAAGTLDYLPGFGIGYLASRLGAHAAARPLQKLLYKRRVNKLSDQELSQELETMIKASPNADLARAALALRKKSSYKVHKRTLSDNLTDENMNNKFSNYQQNKYAADSLFNIGLFRMTRQYKTAGLWDTLGAFAINPIYGAYKAMPGIGHSKATPTAPEAVSPAASGIGHSKATPTAPEAVSPAAPGIGITGQGRTPLVSPHTWGAD